MKHKYSFIIGALVALWVIMACFSVSASSDSYTVALNCENCSVSGSNTLTVSKGQDAVFEISPLKGYDFEQINGGATYSEITENNIRKGTVTLKNVTENADITITFKKRAPITLSVGTGSGGIGDIIKVPVSISENSNASVGVTNIFYDETAVEFLGIDSSDCVPTGILNVEKALMPGKLGLYFISPVNGQVPLTEGGVFVYMLFRPYNNTPDCEIPLDIYAGSSDIHTTYVNDLECSREVLVNGGKITVKTEDDGKFILKTASFDNGGTVSSFGGRFLPGQEVTLTAIAKTGYEFAHWEAEIGSFIDPQSATSLYIMGNSDTTVYAHFKVKKHSINLFSGEGGYLTSDFSEIEHGGSVTIKINEIPGYKLSSLSVGNTDVTSQVIDGTYTVTNITSAQSIKASFTWQELDIIENISFLRAYGGKFSNKYKTITVNAYNSNATAGFALKIAGDVTVGSYTAKSDSLRLSSGIKDDTKYVIALRSQGLKQSFDLNIKYNGYEYTYKVTFNFVSIPVTDLVVSGGFSSTLDTTNKTVKIKADRYGSGVVNFAFVVPTSYSATYNGIINFVSSSEYKGVNGGNYGLLSLASVNIEDGATQHFTITLKGGIYLETYTVSISYRDVSYEGNVIPTKVMPRRLSSYTLDTATKTVYAVSEKGATSAGISFDFNGSPPTKYTTISGQGLVSGEDKGYRYFICRKSGGLEQQFKVKVYGADGYEYSWYTVNIKYI